MKGEKVSLTITTVKELSVYIGAELIQVKEVQCGSFILLSDID